MREGYVAFIVEARPRRLPKHDPLPFDDIDGNGLDFVTLVDDELDRYVGRRVPESHKGFQSAYRFTSRDDAWLPGATFVEGETGPYGASGRLVRVGTGDARDYANDEAAMIPIRCAFVTIPGERFALLLCERRGARTIRDGFRRSILDSAAKAAKVTLRVSGHVDPEAWSSFLDNAEVASVKAVYRSKRQEDYLPTIRSQPNLTMIAGGVPARRMGRALVAPLAQKLRGDGKQADAVLLGDLKPANSDDYARERVTIEAYEGDVKRTITYERDGMPQWVYETQGRLQTPALKDLWEASVPELLAPYLSGP